MSDDYKKNCMKSLQKLHQEELEFRIDSLLATCRTEVDIAKTSEQGAMFRKGPFQIGISLAVKMKKYQDDLLYCRRNPYDVLLSVCADNGWGVPEFKAVDYTVGEGFLFSIIVNDHKLVSKWRGKQPLIAADLAAANFLRYLGLWVNVKNLNLIFDWEQITCREESGSSQNSGPGNALGYLYFMGFNVVKTESKTKESTSKSVVSLKANASLQMSKLVYSFLTSREEKVCWLTDLDISYFKQLFGELESNASYVLNIESWNSDKVCSCENKLNKICFVHENYFIYHLLKDYMYVNKYGPVNCEIFEKLRNVKKEKGETVKFELEGTLSESKQHVPVHMEGVCKRLGNIKKEKVSEDQSETNHSNYSGNLMVQGNKVKEEKPSVKSEIKKVKEEKPPAKCESKEILKPKEPARDNQCFSRSSGQQSSSTASFDPTETPVNLRQKKFDLRSKLFGKLKEESEVKEENLDFKVAFDSETGISNIRTSVGSWISVADLGSPKMPIPRPINWSTSSGNIITDTRQMKRATSSSDRFINAGLMKGATSSNDNFTSVRPMKRATSSSDSFTTARPMKRATSSSNSITTVVTSMRRATSSSTSFTTARPMKRATSSSDSFTTPRPMKRATSSSNSITTVVTSMRRATSSSNSNTTARPMKRTSYISNSITTVVTSDRKRRK